MQAAAVGCEKPARLHNRLTPADLYPGMARCLEQEAYTDAVVIFALAGAYSHYDAQRVADATARQAHAVLLRNTLAPLDAVKQKRFLAELRQTMSKQERLQPVCREVARIGPPDYYPRYMIQHGQSAMVTGYDDGLRPDFDREAAWRRSLDGYLRCPIE
ncbi:MAG: hypothetical protein QM639_05615 [Rhodocyclaceae bacterium]